MATKVLPPIGDELLDAIRDFPTTREVEHCGQVHSVSPFAVYFTCSACGTTRKLRGFSGPAEIEDLFDAVFAWMKQPGVLQHIHQRQHELDQAE